MTIASIQNFPGEEYAKFMERQEKRRIKVKEVCKKYNKTNEKLTTIPLGFLADKKGKFIFCNNYKVASSNWRRVFALVNGNNTEEDIDRLIEKTGRENDFTPGRVFHRDGLRLTNTIPFEYLPRHRKRDLLQKAYKFTCVRNPFERLLSAWRDKFALKDPMNQKYHQKIGTFVIKNFRANATDAARRAANGVTLQEFLLFVILAGKRGKPAELDPHWRPFHAHCQFCATDFHAIIHLENISYEAPFILSKIAVSSRKTSKFLIRNTPWGSKGKYLKFLKLQEERQQQIREVCKKYNRNKDRYKQIKVAYIVDVDNRFMFCNNYKVASSNWRRAIAYVNNNCSDDCIKRVVEESGITTEITPGRAFHSYEPGHKLMRAVMMESLPVKQQIQILLNTFKFTCVRNPFERILSAWRDKLSLPDPDNDEYHKTLGREIIQMFRPNAMETSLETGHDVTFLEFLQFLILKGREGEYNMHWIPYYINCQFCVVKYDVITHLETISDEAPFVLSTLAGDRPTSKEAIAQFPAPDYGPSSKQWKDKTNTSTVLETYYRDIPADILDEIRELYAIDFEMFGYDRFLPFEKTRDVVLTK